MNSPNQDEPKRGATSFKDIQNGIVLWLAQGFGVGRIPWAPGTFGSVVGLLWFAVLLADGSFWIYLVGTIAGTAASILICDTGERVLGQRDPGSIVMDEIIALPICFLGWIALFYFKHGVMPELSFFLSSGIWPITIAVFLLFRLFDVAKPWPVRQSQALPGGWGVTVDDVLAAVYVNLAMLLGYCGKLWLHGASAV